ncbi:hypothetical protein MHYP_G00063780 [Metynnis hypsauchen]
MDKLKHQTFDTGVSPSLSLPDMLNGKSVLASRLLPVGAQCVSFLAKERPDPASKNLINFSYCDSGQVSDEHST